MLDMFYNYDNDIDKKYYALPVTYKKPTKILQNENTVKIVYNVWGDQIGVQVSYQDDFYLYFNLDGIVEDSSIEKLLEQSTISFKLYNLWDKVVINKTIDFSCFEAETSTLAVYVTKEEAAKLKQETYKMELSLSWVDGDYTLFSKRDGMLLIR